jgi:hypothetical protein
MKIGKFVRVMFMSILIREKWAEVGTLLIGLKLRNLWLSTAAV